MTKYHWPTWADIISQEIPESYNYGQSGGGNLFISNQVVEMNLRYKFDSNDLVIIMWSGVCREDRWLHGTWITPGNIYNQNFYDHSFIKRCTDTKGYLIRDLNLISMCKGYLDNLGIEYYMLNMAPFDTAQHDSKGESFTNLSDVLDLYKDTISFLKPDILTTVYKGVWPQHSIKNRNQRKGPLTDYHPDTMGHYEYLRKIFPNIKLSDSTIEFVTKYQSYIHQVEYLDELETLWPITSLKRL